MRRPPAAKVHPHQPSPLAQVHGMRPLSIVPGNKLAGNGGLVRDPNFWKRFSLAVHMTEDVEKVPQSATSSNSSSYGDDWLLLQRQDKRRYRLIGWSVGLLLIIIITAAAVFGWYFLVARKTAPS